MRMHIEKEHGTVFEYLLKMDKKITGLTEHQKNLLWFFFHGKSDEEIKQFMQIGSTTTIRNHRFILKEKERQAKVFLTLMELLKDTNNKQFRHDNALSRVNKSEANRNASDTAKEKTLYKYFKHGLDGPLSTFDIKEKSKLVVLQHISERFEAERMYSEKEINEILETVHEDTAILRRALIDYGFMERQTDGSEYRLKNNHYIMRGDKMDRRKELKEQYKEIKTEAGVFQIKNKKNNKAFIVAAPNLRMINGRLMELRGGMHKNKKLQEEWSRYGEEAFVIEVLEVLKEEEEGVFFDKQEELKKLEQKWLDKIQPYGERGYNYIKI
ncbi:MAG: transcriptional regulator [Firmicutes bacterium HGW-Firmicutes-12]|nr:MAG: transcriptional regulator [Firmicutes bacterium HGW-Firmicutes-12]